MGFPCVAMKIPTCFRSVFLQDMVILLKMLVVAAITHLGFLKSPEEQSPAEEEDPSNRYVFLTDGACPSPVPVSVNLLTTLIKRNLPVVTYERFLARREVDDEALGRGCSVCLEKVELCDEIRELCNCCHVFHRQCLERWVDEGQITCPLCRSMLFEEKTGLRDAMRLQRHHLPY